MGAVLEAGRAERDDTAGAVSVVVLFGAWKALEYVHVHLGLGAFGRTFLYGAATFARVVVVFQSFALLPWLTVQGTVGTGHAGP